MQHAYKNPVAAGRRGVPASGIETAVAGLAVLPMHFVATPPLSLTLMLAFTCCTLLVVLGILGAGFLLVVGKGNAAKDDGKRKSGRPG